jgi:hypothetical protein
LISSNIPSLANAAAAMAPEVLRLRGLIEGWAREPETDAAEKGVTHPKPAVTAVMTDNDFASLLDRRLKRIEEMKAKAIEGAQVEVKPALP